jgi:hypothetical protein
MPKLALRLVIASSLLLVLVLPSRLAASPPDCGCTVWPTFTEEGTVVSYVTPVSTACEELYNSAVTASAQQANNRCVAEGFIRSCNRDLYVASCLPSSGGGWERSWSVTFGCWVCA